jgi:class 3 adenylate cyclase
MPTVRRLTAILAADVAGYSRLMGADEEATHERLRAHLRELIEPKIVEHRGRSIATRSCSLRQARRTAERGGLPTLAGIRASNKVARDNGH